MGKKREKKVVFMIAFSEVKYDGRVIRAAEALSEQYSVRLVGLGDYKFYKNQQIVYYPIYLPLKSKWLQHIVFLIKVILLALRVHPDIVHAHDYFLVLHGWLSAKIAGAKSVYDAHEFFPGIKEKSHIRHWFFATMEKFLIRRYSLIIATSKERALVMKEYFKLKQIPNVVQNFPSSEKNTNVVANSVFVDKIILECKFDDNLPLIIYQGNMDVSARCLDILLKAFIELRERCCLLMVGDGPDLNYLRSLVLKFGLNEMVKFTGKMSRNMLPVLMKRVSVGIVIYSNKGLNNKLCTPNKIYEYAQVGLAVVTSNQTPLKRMILKNPIGEIFNPNDYLSIKNAICKVLSNIEYYKSFLPQFIEKNSWFLEKTKLINSYKDLENK